MKYFGMKDCIEKYASENDISKREAEIRIRSFLDILKDSILDTEYDGVQFINFITFKKFKTKSKIGCNPRNPKQKYTVPKKTIIKADMGKSLNRELNGDIKSIKI